MHRVARRFACVSLAASVFGAQAIAADIASDPMRPDTLQQVAAPAAAQLRVNAIIVSDERRIAIVSGRRVGVGDAIGDATVIAISKAEVVVDVDGSERTLRLNGGAGQ